uniref:(northern house mosquito) hypothetical protein n=1 Tax=Culex pipiens TaxID=7175 RepID=A0A8D8HKN2_CULPI
MASSSERSARTPPATRSSCRRTIPPTARPEPSASTLSVRSRPAKTRAVPPTRRRPLSSSPPSPRGWTFRSCTATRISRTPDFGPSPEVAWLPSSVTATSGPRITPTPPPSATWSPATRSATWPEIPASTRTPV